MKIKQRRRLASVRKKKGEVAKYFNDDPFMEYGFGMLAFFKVLKTLIFTFMIITIFLAGP